MLRIRALPSAPRSRPASHLPPREQPVHDMRRERSHISYPNATDKAKAKSWVSVPEAK